MRQKFQGWNVVSERLRASADCQNDLAETAGESVARLNEGQRASLRELANRLPTNGAIVADEVGMGKTRIAVELIRSVQEAGGRVAVLLPPGLGYQWQTELTEGGVDAPPMIRSLLGYFRPWASNPAEPQKAWFDESVVVISHAFTNWRLGEKADPWRWAMLPEIYAHWRLRKEARLPRGYYKQNGYERVENAAKEIIQALPLHGAQHIRQKLDELTTKVQWGKLLYDGSQYARDAVLRSWLEFSVGLGFGVFDLIVIDEAHKSRGTDSGLTRLLENVVLYAQDARRLAITATPVELDISQWQQTLRRIKVAEESLKEINESIQKYDQAVKSIRRTWRSSEESRQNYMICAQAFEKALRPFLLRRDKREDMTVQLFQKISGLPLNAYRREVEICVETANLSKSWKRAVCAAEALSLVTTQGDFAAAKRLRLVHAEN